MDSRVSRWRSDADEVGGDGALELVEGLFVFGRLFQQGLVFLEKSLVGVLDRGFGQLGHAHELLDDLFHGNNRVVKEMLVEQLWEPRGLGGLHLF